MPETNPDTNTQQEGNQQNNQSAPAIDYDKLAEIIAGKQSATEDSVLKGYFKQQGLSGDEMKQAIDNFKAEKKKNTPDVNKMQSDLSVANQARLNAEINQSATVEAIKQGVDVNSIPYVLKMADFKDVADKDGNINTEKLTEAIKKVLDDVPALKGSSSSEGNNGSGVQKIGGDGSEGGNSKPDNNKNTVPQKRWNRWNN